jgi:hypothetical protein
MTHRIIKREKRDIEKLNETNVQFIHSNNKLIYKRFTFHISSNYPFAPPKLLINDIEYINYFIYKYASYHKKIPFINVKCPCCYNITCNWCPSYSFKHMFDEYKSYSLEYQNLFRFYIVYKSQYFDDLIYKNILNYII